MANREASIAQTRPSIHPASANSRPTGLTDLGALLGSFEGALSEGRAMDVPVYQDPQPDPVAVRDATFGAPACKPIYQREVFFALFMALGLPMGAHVLFQEVCRSSGLNGFTWKSTERFASQLGCSSRTIQRYLSRLVEAGALTRLTLRFCWKEGHAGSKRVLIPHEWDGSKFVAPKGVLEDPTALSWRSKRVAVDAITAFPAPSGGVTRVSPLRARVPPSGIEERNAGVDLWSRSRSEPRPRTSWWDESIRTPYPSQCMEGIRAARTGSPKALKRLWRASKLWFLRLEDVWKMAGQEVQDSDRAMWARMQSIPLGAPPAWWVEAREVLSARN